MKSKRITLCGILGAALVLGIMSAFFVQISAVKQDPEMLDDGDDFAVGEYLPDAVEGITQDTDTPDVSYEVDGKSETVCVDVVLTCPLDGYTAVTGKFGEQVTPFGKVLFNTGMNIAAEEGTDVYAAASGTVITAEYDSKQGNYVVIDHGNGCETVYRHLDEVYCEAGDEVKTEHRIGTVGQTGTVTGPNLGFAIIKDGTYVSPAELFE